MSTQQIKLQQPEQVPHTLFSIVEYLRTNIEGEYIVRYHRADRQPPDKSTRAEFDFIDVKLYTIGVEGEEVCFPDQSTFLNDGTVEVNDATGAKYVLKFSKIVPLAESDL